MSKDPLNSTCGAFGSWWIPGKKLLKRKDCHEIVPIFQFDSWPK